jgi:hypothetical protein
MRNLICWCPETQQPITLKLPTKRAVTRACGYKPSGRRPLNPLRFWKELLTAPRGYKGQPTRTAPRPAKLHERDYCLPRGFAPPFRPSRLRGECIPHGVAGGSMQHERDIGRASEAVLESAHSSFHFEPVRRAAGAVWRAEPLADDAFEPFSNVVTSRSMNHKGVEFLILARPGRDQWTVVMSYPRSTSPTKVAFEGSRDKSDCGCSCQD